jgi:hypothetical protein
MSDVSNGPGWWKASDLKWYPPETHPDYIAAHVTTPAAVDGPKTSPGPGWWLASDLNWYPPETHAEYVAPDSGGVTFDDSAPPPTKNLLRFGVAIGGLFTALSTTFTWGHTHFGTFTFNATVYQTRWHSLIPHDGELFVVVGLALITLGLAQLGMTRRPRSYHALIVALCVVAGLELVSELNILAINLGSPNASLGLSSSPGSGWWICWFGLGLATASAIVELARRNRA